LRYLLCKFTLYEIDRQADKNYKVNKVRKVSKNVCPVWENKKNEKRLKAEG
jgi:hypothetical protein